MLFVRCCWLLILFSGVALLQKGASAFGAVSIPTTSSPFKRSCLEAQAQSDTLNELVPEAISPNTCKVKIGLSKVHGLGLFATTNIQKNDVLLSVPYDSSLELNSDTELFKSVLPKDYDSWTGSTGMIALLLLNELALLENAGLPVKKRSTSQSKYMKQWVQTLPWNDSSHPLLWNEDDQEVLQSSTTNKIYQKLDDLEEDATWLVENVFDKDRTRFPSTIIVDGQTYQCFSEAGFRKAMAIANSRTFFLKNTLRLLPLFDFCNHQENCDELQDGSFGAFGSVKGAQLVASRDYQLGEEVFCSYGPKSMADYLLEHGFLCESKLNVSELTFELDPEDRFYDDKLDILEFETYGDPMDPVQKFDVISAPGRDGNPDPAMIQFLRLSKLGSTDAFLLESIFRKEVWGFMELPVSEQNELAVVDTIIEACEAALSEFSECPKGGPDVCQELRESETKALQLTIEYLSREKEALDLKEYYQERRLKDLGLDSVWTPEDEGFGEDLSFGQTRAPGGADYDMDW